jgi:3-oxoacyl-[acyl-carrier-protein] synthase II
MAASSRRAVLTGIGVLSPIGSDLTGFWHALVSGQSGIRPLHAYDTTGLPVIFAGEIQNFDAKKFIPKEDKARKSLKVMARTIQLAVSAAQLALTDSAIDKQKLDPTRFGIEFGAGLIASELDELGTAAQVSSNCQPGAVDLEKWGEQGLPTIQPLWMLKYLPNMLACHVSIIHDAQGPNNTVTQSDVAGLLALGEAYRIIGRDQADFFLVGGADSRLGPTSMVRQCLFLPLSHRNDAPDKACRPFDRGRDGIVLGEGAGVLVLEELEHARRRGARIYAEVVGFGAAFDRDLSGAGLARAIRAALGDAGIGPEDVDHINASGFSSIPADIMEARALHEVFGDSRTPVTAVKSYIGNLGAGSATTELAASLYGLGQGAVPPTLNYEEPDPDCPVAVIARNPRPVEKPYFLKVAFTEMGQCAALICRRM